MQETEHTFRYSVNLVWNQDTIYRRYWHILSVNTNKKLSRDLCVTCDSCPCVTALFRADFIAPLVGLSKQNENSSGRKSERRLW